MSGYPRRYEGTRWQILFGSYEGVEKFAVNELQRMVQVYLPYVMSVESSNSKTPAELEHLILVGTPSNNALIADLINRKILSAPVKPQGYSIAYVDSPWKDGQKVIALAGYDASGVLYGVEDFNARILSDTWNGETQARNREAFDNIRKFDINEYPAIDYRGIWTWGYVIYDYKRFLDNMARLKMNTLTVWNDCPPLNFREILDYAHSRGVRVIPGFHWGWGIPDLDPNNPDHKERTKREVVDNYVKDYSGLPIDGIYFQTFTEHWDMNMGGKSTAALACEWVNEIAAALFEIKPDLRIEFGLHATSILDKYTDLKPLDPRVTITWEDAGTLPYTYDPEEPPMTSEDPKPHASFEATVDYSKRLAGFRENREFSMVAKGWICLRWHSEFEHHSSFILGERDPGFIRKRCEERQPRWDRVNMQWLKAYPLAARFYREILDTSPDAVSVSALVEDGMFEECVQSSVALFAETVWGPGKADKELLDASNYSSRV